MADKLRAAGFKIIESRGDGFIIPIGGAIQKSRNPRNRTAASRPRDGGGPAAACARSRRERSYPARGLRRVISDTTGHSHRLSCAGASST
jgi:hypothetical protein